MPLFNVLPILAVLFVAALPPTDEIDAFWEEAARTVIEGDFEGYAALYHEDAVLVNAISGNSYPIADALAGWRQGFEDTAAGRMEANVEFRFTQRLHGESTAHETGIFAYSGYPVGEEAEPTYVHFESLMVKGDDGWLWVMEYQKSLATEDEWIAAGS